jgi:phytoene dehydrogenase-like protein
LHEYGLRIIERRVLNFLPSTDGSYLLTRAGQIREGIARISPADAEKYPAYEAQVARVGDFVRSLLLRTPPNVTKFENRARLPELFKLLRMSNELRSFDGEGLVALHELMTKSAGDYLDRWFESDSVKALFGFDAVVGNYASPYTSGSAYVLLHHTIGGVNGRRGIWGHAIGGMGAITQAMAKAATATGAEISIGSPVSEVMVERDRVAGVVLEDGTTLRAASVASNVTPKLLYTKLVPAGTLKANFSSRINAYRCHSATFRMNVALSELPSFSALPGRTANDHHTAGIILAPSLGYMDRAYCEARLHGWSREPIIEMIIPSTIDGSLVTSEGHVASLFCQHTAYDLPHGRSWSKCREEVADLMIATVERYAPGFSSSVIARQIFSPVDLEETFGLTGGDIFHGALGLDQLFSARPLLGYADYRGPIPGLYHCGSGAHPGGGVTGAPGFNAAREIIRDFSRRAPPWSK